MATELEVLNTVDRLFAVYQEEADPGEKLGDFIDRIGLEVFREKVRNKG